SGGVQWVSLHSHNRLLSGYPYVVIGKTGYTRPARRCYVGAASHDGRELIIALLGADHLWTDARRLLAFGFGAAPERPRVVMAGLVSLPSFGRRARARLAVMEGDDEMPGEAGVAHYAVRLGPYASRHAARTLRSQLARRG